MSKRKNPASSDNLNADFCDFLMELADYEKNVTRNIHKHNAYRKAAFTLAAHHKRIESGDEAKKLSGIGDKISKKIDEFLQTGKLRKLENIYEDSDAYAIRVLTKVSGIGPVKAAQLVSEGIRTLLDLEDNKDKLNHHQLLGLHYFDDFNLKIPREEIINIEKILIENIKKLDSDYTVTICGSYRRGKPESGDIDVLVTHPAVTSSGNKNRKNSEMLKQVVTALEKCELVTDTLAIGDTKFMGVCRLYVLPSRRLDIRLVPSDQYYCAVLYFTGSDMFNKAMRAHALEHNFTLNEYTLRTVGSTGVPGEPVPINSEEEIFDYISYPYKKPEERNM